MIADGRAGEVAIRLRTVAELFSPLDPSDWPQKDLAPHADEYIRDWARELPREAPLSILVELPAAEAARPEAAAIPEAVAAWFRGREAAHGAELRELFRVGRLSLLIGLAALAAAILASRHLAPLIPSPTLAELAEEGLFILGWVANWRPLEIWLYEWWPIRRRRRLCARLAAARVTVRAAG